MRYEHHFVAQRVWIRVEVDKASIYDCEQPKGNVSHVHG